MEKRGRMLVVIVAIFLLPFLGGALYALYQSLQGNFHVITKGEAYRSAQMTGNELKRCISNYRIKSIINLRGKMPKEGWYKEEVKISEAAKVMHYDLLLSAYSELSAEEARILTGLFNFAPRPILIHCQGGADRSGLAAAMWKVIVDKEPKAEAGKQLSIVYGHLPFGPASAMDRFFDKWSFAKPVSLNPSVTRNPLP